MPVPANRRRIEIPAALYRVLELDARSLNLSTQALATMLLTEAVQKHCQHAWDQDSGPTITCQRCGLQLHRAGG